MTPCRRTAEGNAVAAIAPAVHLPHRRQQAERDRADAVVDRRVGEITGGTFEGERLRGKILSGGSDWQTVRRDGSWGSTCALSWRPTTAT